MAGVWATVPAVSSGGRKSWEAGEAPNPPQRAEKDLVLLLFYLVFLGFFKKNYFIF